MLSPRFYQYNDGGFFPLLTMPLDLTLTPIYRIHGQDQSSLPGLMAAAPPMKTARGRDRDRLVVYLLLTGNAVFSTGEYVQLASRAAVAFYATPGTITSALRAAAEAVNKPLLERNMSTSGRGQYAVGLLALAAMRGAQATLLLSGPIHAFVLGANGAQDISDSLSGKGLGLSQSSPFYFSQITLQPNDRMLFCGKVPPAWEAALKDPSPASLEATRRRLMTLTTEDLNAALLYAANGAGTLTVLRPTMEPRTDQRTAPPLSSDAERAAAQEAESMPEAHMLQPSAYAIPPQPQEEIPLGEESASPPSDLISTLPRALAPLHLPPFSQKMGGEKEGSEEEAEITPEPSAPRQPSERTRQTAKKIANGLQALRRGNERVGEGVRKFLPRLLPGAGDKSLAVPSSAMIFISLLIPLVVVTVASLVYFRYGRSVQYEQYLIQAQDARAQAVSLADPIAQREAWQRELFYLDKADSTADTGETRALRQEAQASLDKLQGITRLQFQPVLNTGLGAQISRLAASESDLYLLDAQRGSILRINLTSGGFQRDTSFNCAPGVFGEYTVGPLVDILAMPPNTIKATVIGVDAAGNLLYCAPGQVAQAIPLPPPDTNWNRITAFALDSGNLYVMDARARAVWVYVGKDGAFIDRPYFFFGGQIPNLEDAIDLAINGDNLYILHSDGHLSNCSYSRIEAVPTRCVEPVTLVNPFPAYQDQNIFAEAHFTQTLFMPAPDSSLLLLDSDSQGVFRFTPRSQELQNQLRPLAGRDNPLPPGPVSAMTVSPNYVIYLAVQDKVYFAVESP